MKKMIFHYPSPIVDNGRSASAIRPVKMQQAFRMAGYEVFSVTGYGKERQQKINQLKKDIRAGVKFDFVYSESLTMPTLLSEKNHLPSYPFLDFSFFKYCQQSDIKVGVFYRDIYWRFPELYETKSIIHTLVAKTFYYYDLFKYRSLDRVFLPSNEMKKYVPVVDNCKFMELPPGTVKIKNTLNHCKSDQRLNILYVGGLSDGYPMLELFKAVSQCDFVYLTLCTRKEDWDKFPNKDLLSNNIKIVHKSGDELEELYSKADICSLIFEPQEWRSFAFPYKFFEYISFGKPIVAIGSTPPSRVINEEGIGWSLDYTSDAILKLFETIRDDRSLLNNALKNVESIAEKYTWEKRALQVASALSNIPD